MSVPLSRKAGWSGGDFSPLVQQAQTMPGALLSLGHVAPMSHGMAKPQSMG